MGPPTFGPNRGQIAESLPELVAQLDRLAKLATAEITTEEALRDWKFLAPQVAMRLRAAFDAPNGPPMLDFYKGMIAGLNERIDAAIHDKDGWRALAERYSERITDELLPKITALQESLKHCVRVLEEYERKPGDDLRPFLLGALDHAKKTLGVKDDKTTVSTPDRDDHASRSV